MCGESGPCPECGEIVVAPGSKAPKKLPAIQYLKEDNDDPQAESQTEKQELQVDVYVENERSANILPGLLPKKVGDIILPAFIVIRRRPRWVTATLTFVAMSPLLWVAAFYLPEVKTTFLSFETFRQRQLEFVERLLHSSAEAQAALDRKERMASSRPPDKPQVRPARKVETAANTTQPAKPAEATSSASSRSSASSLASPPPAKPSAPVASSAPPAYSSPYNPPPPEPYHPGGNSSASSNEPVKEDWPQMVLRNNGIFAGHTPVRSGCSFLIHDEKGAVWLATSPKLLGFEGGVAPPVDPGKVAEDLHLWRSHFPDDPNSFVDASGGSGLTYAVDPGWLALKLSASPRELPSIPLKLRHNPPAVGELLYLVGLPTDDRTGASQHMYAGRVTSSQQQDPSLFGFALETPFKLNGFTGAPLVDLRGELVGVLSGGRTSLLIATKADRLEVLIRGK